MQELVRHPDWEQRLSDYIKAVSGDIESLGPVPCARFAAGAIEAQTGVDYYAPFKGKYKTEIGAAKALRSYGAGTLEATFDLFLNRRIAPAFAQRGDIIFNGESVGVCIGATALFISENSWAELARDKWSVAWAASNEGLT